MKTTVIAVFAAVVLCACNRAPATPTYWCEHDDSDVVVANSFCEQNLPGYEWEPDDDDYAHPTVKKTTTKTVVKTTTTSAPKTVKPTVKKTPKKTTAR